MATKTLINDPLLAEFTYDVIMLADQKDKAKLTQRQLRNISTPKRTKRYSEYTTLDEKLLLLMRLGCSYEVRIFRTKTHNGKHLKELFEKYKRNLSEDTVTDVLQSGLAVTTDREIAAFANLLGSLCHSDTYMLNRDFYRVVSHGRKANQIESPTVENVREAMEDFETVNKMFLRFSLLIKHIKGISNALGDVDFNILMLLFSKRKLYLMRQDIQKYFKGLYKPALITSALKRLMESVMVEKNPLKDGFMITSLGIEEVMMLHKRIVSETFSF